MKQITKQDFLENINFYLNEILEGKIFIYPTDTLYGIGGIKEVVGSCKLEVAERKIYEIKKREKKPFLIIVPSFDWILGNCTISKENFDFLKSKLPGPYSFILKLKGKEETIGIRIPNNWFSKEISKLNICFISTSVNFAGQPSALSIKEIPNEIRTQVDYIIEDDEKLLGKASIIIDLTKNKKVLRK